MLKNMKEFAQSKQIMLCNYNFFRYFFKKKVNVNIEMKIYLQYMYALIPNCAILYKQMISPMINPHVF